MGKKNKTARILEYMKGNQDKFANDLLDFVNIETPSIGNHKEMCDAGVSYIIDKFKEIGYEAETFHLENSGDAIRVCMGKQDAEGTIMLVGHLDTVFPPNTIGTQMFPRIENGKLYGPGALDMKGGVLSMIYAVKALQELDMMPDKKIIAIVNSDEESGSFESRDIIIQQAKESKCVFCLEPAPTGYSPGALKTERFGRSEYQILIHGKSAHSGNNPHDAINPVIEMGKLIHHISNIENDYEDVISSIVYANTGRPKSAMIPGEAELYVDLRYGIPSIGQEIDSLFKNMKPFNEDISLEVIGGIEKPPLTFAEDLFNLAVQIGKEMDIEVTRNTVGGGSDGCFTSGAGTPTLDGLGMNGEFIHNIGEFVYVDTIPYRVTLLARLLQEA
ncbi:MAG: M20/M25/M40 family metallo-hydrolase [Lentihominibacter sp.]|jgi:glutamate carboxypeptidase